MTDAILADIYAKYPDSFIVLKHGLGAIPLLKNTGSNFNQLDGDEIYRIINFSDAHIADAGGHRSKAIELLSSAGADFSKLSGDEIYNIINSEFETIHLLKSVGTDFSKLDADSFYSLVREFGSEVIAVFRGAGVPQHVALNPNKIAAIKGLCEPIIEENLYKNAQTILKLEALLEEVDFFQKYPNIKDSDELRISMQSLPELMNSINSLYSDMGSYQVDVNGKKIHHVIYSREQDGDLVNDIFPVSKEGKLIYWTKIIDCEDLIEDYDYSNIFTYNQLAIMLNKHGYNLKVDPEPNYSDAEIEVLYGSVNFIGTAYGEFASCQEYANSLSGDGIAAKAIEYC